MHMSGEDPEPLIRGATPPFYETTPIQLPQSEATRRERGEISGARVFISADRFISQIL